MIENPFERVRQSTAWVTQQARLVRGDWTRLTALAATFDPAAILARYTFEDEFHFYRSKASRFMDGDNQHAPMHYSPEAKALLEYVITLDALNFGSAFSGQWAANQALVQNSGYKTMATALKAYLEAGNTLNANFAASTTAQQLGMLFNLPHDFKLIIMFAESLNQLGRFVLANYGDYAQFVSAQASGAALVQTLTQNLPFFDDCAIYEGETVYFYKRAQILVNDLFLAFEGQSFGYFADIAELTTFADNLVPHFFRVEGVLEYEPNLAQAIERGELLPAGSAGELEIRAWGVQCVERACHLINERAGKALIFPAQLDVYLWNVAQAARYKSHPRHHTQTHFY